MAQVAAVANRLKAKLSLTFGKDAEGFVSSLLDGTRQIQAGKVASDLSSRGLSGAKPKKLENVLAPAFLGDKKALSDFVATIRGGAGKVKNIAALL